MSSPSHRLGTVQIDRERLDADLSQVEHHGFVDSYTEFVCGSWRTCMLWNPSGDSRDSLIRDFSGRPQMTEYGRKLSYLEEIMNNNFDLEQLRFARLTRLMPDTVVVPHRDYLELDKELVRIHVPLETDADAYTSEEETIYRMGLGEVWFLDATKVHSIANFSTTTRTHLLLDFGAEEPHQVVRAKAPHPESMPPESVVVRRQLRPGEREALQALSQIIDATNFMDVFAIVIKRYFVADIDVRDVFSWLADIAAGSGNTDVLARAKWLEQHSITNRES
jgi:L-proline cis-4-hydroxylase